VLTRVAALSTLSTRAQERGTRFLIYPQSKRLPGFRTPEVVYVDAPPGSIKPGPEDTAIYIVDAVDKLAYREGGGKPPYTGPRFPPAAPDPEGHFDHIDPTNPAFPSATVYAAVRCVLAIWEGYFGRQLPWYFRRKYPRLEVVPQVQTDTAYSGDGYLEFGFANRANPFCELFDVVAHEMGHLINWEVIGKPRRRSMVYRANDEACADLVSIVSSLHFDSVVNHLLEHTKGNLFSVNELARIGDLGKTRQARIAFNARRMSTVRRDRDRDRYKYNLSLPFTGGAFDILVGIYERGLIHRGAIPAALAQRSHYIRRREIARIQREFGQRFSANPAKFTRALLDARDIFGRLLARAWDKTAARHRSHAGVAKNMIAADNELTGGRYGSLIRESFAWREILPPRTP